MKFRLYLTKLLKIGREHGGYFITTFINSSIPLLLLPVLTRYLEPAEYANIALFNFYIALSNTLSGTSMPVVISKHFFDNPKEYIAKLIGNSIRITFAFSAVVSILMLLLYPITGDFLNLPRFWLVLIPWGSFFYVLLSLALTVFRNQKKVLLFSYYKVGTTAVNVVLSIFLVTVLLWGWQGRISGVLISYFVGAVVSLTYLYKHGFIKIKYSKKVSKSILSVVIPLITNAFQSVIISRVGIFFMQLYFTKQLLGIFSVAYQLSDFIHLLFMTITFSWNPFVYEQISKKAKADKISIVRGYYFITIILILGVVFVNTFSTILLKIFTTEQYFSAKEFIPWLTIGMLFYGMYVYLLPILMKNEKQKALSLISLINMVLMIGLNILLVNVYDYMGIVYAFTSVYFLMFFPILILTQKTYPLPWKKALNIRKI